MLKFIVFFLVLIFFVNIPFFANAEKLTYKSYCLDPVGDILYQCLKNCKEKDEMSKSFKLGPCCKKCSDDYDVNIMKCKSDLADKTLQEDKNLTKNDKKTKGTESCLYLIKNLSQSKALNTEYYNAVNCCSYIINIEWDCVGGKRMHDPKSYTIEPNMRGRYDMNCSPGSTLTGKAKRVDKMDAGTRYGYPTSFCEQKKSSDPSDVVKSVEVNK